MLFTLLLLVAVIMLSIMVATDRSFGSIAEDVKDPLNLIIQGAPEIGMEHYNHFIDDDTELSKMCFSRKTWARVEGTGEKVFLYIHGRDENVLTITHFLRLIAQNPDYTAVSFDFSGFGGRQADAKYRTVDAFNRETTRVYEWIEKNLSEDIVVLARDFGTGPAIELARNKDAPLHLLDAYTSTKHLLQEHAQPIAHWFGEKWNNFSAIQSCQGRVHLYVTNDHPWIGENHSATLSLLVKREPEDGEEVIGVPVRTIESSPTLHRDWFELIEASLD